MGIDHCRRLRAIAIRRANSSKNRSGSKAGAAGGLTGDFNLRSRSYCPGVNGPIRWGILGIALTLGGTSSFTAPSANHHGWGRCIALEEGPALWQEARCFPTKEPTVTLSTYAPQTGWKEMSQERSSLNFLTDFNCQWLRHHTSCQVMTSCCWRRALRLRCIVCFKVVDCWSLALKYRQGIFLPLNSAVSSQLTKAHTCAASKRERKPQVTPTWRQLLLDSKEMSSWCNTPDKTCWTLVRHTEEGSSCPAGELEWDKSIESRHAGLAARCFPRRHSNTWYGL